MTILRARPEDAPTLTAIAFVAKRHWRYPEEWIEHWRDLLTIQPEFVATHEVYAASVDDRIAGFYALCPKGSRLELQHLWVLPEFMHRGFGRSLFLHALACAKKAGFLEIEIESDPNAEGFYRRMGARRVGINRTTLDGSRRELPVLIYEITK